MRRWHEGLHLFCNSVSNGVGAPPTSAARIATLIKLALTSGLAAPNHGAPAQHIVDVFVVVDIINAAALALMGLELHRRNEQVQYAAWHITFSLFKGLFRFTELEHRTSLLL